MIAQYMDQSEAKILIVDDKPENLRLLTTILKEAGYVVRQLRSGKRVLASVLDDPPCLILLDIMMPETDGYEVCRDLKSEERTRGIPVIFISALEDVADKIKGFSVGGVDYITKPFREEEVLVRVKTHLSLRGMQTAGNQIPPAKRLIMFASRLRRIPEMNTPNKANSKDRSPPAARE